MQQLVIKVTISIKFSRYEKGETVRKNIIPMNKNTGKDNSMIKNKDILEIKRRFKKDACTITRMCGCYVDSAKNKVMKLDENFLNLDDEKFYKYLEIVKKSISGTIGNNMLDLKFLSEEQGTGGKQQYFLGLRESGLKNQELLEHLYDMIINDYDYAGNYLILVFHDAYDVITKTRDDMKLDESEEVFTYLICAICPVNLSKPGLCYNGAENDISPIEQDWVVGMPDTAFMYPSFIDRSTDVNTVTYYVRDAKDSRPDFVEAALGCESKRTATEEKSTFEKIVKTAIAPIMEKSDEIMMELQEQLSEAAEENREREEGMVNGDSEEFLLDHDTVHEVLKKIDVPDAVVKKIQEQLDDEFKDSAPTVDHLYDEKELAKKNKEKKEQALQEEIATLKSELEEMKEANNTFESPQAGNISISTGGSTDDISIREIEGKKYVLIPIENESLLVNGIAKEY